MMTCGSRTQKFSVSSSRLPSFRCRKKLINHLEKRTEGWCAGLRLIALALLRRDPQEIEVVLQELSGTHRPILDYLVTDVLFAQPAEIQTFLLQTCFLKRLTGSLCDAVTGSVNGDERLDDLEATNVFLVSLGDGWYGYHPLFGEAMQHYAQRQLDEIDHHARLERASIWYEQHGFLAEAVDVALDAHAFSRAVDLIEHLLSDDFPNELVTLQGWIERIPEDMLQDHPAVAFAYAVAILFTPERHLPATLALPKTPSYRRTALGDRRKPCATGTSGSVARIGFYVAGGYVQRVCVC